MMRLDFKDARRMTIVSGNRFFLGEKTETRCRLTTRACRGLHFETVASLDLKIKKDSRTHELGKKNGPTTGIRLLKKCNFTRFVNNRPIP